MRYLGVFLGTNEAVARVWEEKVTGKIRQRYGSWLSQGGARTLFGRNIVVKNSVMAVAWFLVQRQCLPNLDDMLAEWERLTWAYIETTWSGGVCHHSIRRAQLVQDYAEGGARCLDIEVFCRSLYLRQVRLLLDPNPQAWRGLGWHFVQSAYGHLGMGRGILTSNCDFLAVLGRADIPIWWQSVLVAWGGLPGLVPAVDQEGMDPCVGWAEARQRGRTVAVRADWTAMVVANESLFYNLHFSGIWGARVLEVDSATLERTHRSGDAVFARVSQERRDIARKVLQRYSVMAAAGVTHVRHLLRCENGQLRWARHGELGMRRGSACELLPPGVYVELLKGVPAQWRAAIEAANAAVAGVVPAPDMATVLASTASPDGRRSWVELTDGVVCERRGVSLQSEAYGVSPSRRLFLLEGCVPRAAVAREVIVWSEPGSAVPLREGARGCRGDCGVGGASAAAVWWCGGGGGETRPRCLGVFGHGSSAASSFGVGS